MNTGNAIKIFDAGGLKVTRAVPEKHIINFFWPYGLRVTMFIECDKSHVYRVACVYI